MKTFKQFVAEDWKNESDEFGRTIVTHRKKIGPHNVEVTFDGSPNKDKSVYIDYKVDGWVTRGAADVKPEHREKILRHVIKTIHRYKKRLDPNAFSMIPNERKKDKAYRSLVKRMAREYGGQDISTPGAARVKLK